MHDAGVEELGSLGREADALVERDRAHLGIQHDLVPGLRMRPLDQALQDRVAHAAPAPVRQHRQAPDRALGGQTPGADRVAVAVARQHVVRDLVERVPLVLVGTDCSWTNTRSRTDLSAAWSCSHVAASTL
jgi:hypothetical protein